VINDPADGVAELARRAVAGGIQELAESGEGQLLTFAVRALFLTERYPEAQGLLDAAIAGARAAGNRMVLPELLSIRAWLGVRRGDLAAAEADARAVSEAVSEGGAKRVWWPSAATGALVVAARSACTWSGSPRTAADLPALWTRPPSARAAAVHRGGRGLSRRR
jgi:hypothetical protein